MGSFARFVYVVSGALMCLTIILLPIGILIFVLVDILAELEKLNKRKG